MSEKIMSRGELVNTIAAHTKLPAGDVESIIKELESAIVRKLEEGGEIRLPGFGTFKTAQRGAREARNPRTGEPLSIAARSVVRFVPGKLLKEIGAKTD